PYVPVRNQHSFPTRRSSDLRANPPDFIAFNYYATTTVEHFPVSEVHPIGTKLGRLLPEAEAGMYRIVKNPNLGATDWGWEIDPVDRKSTRLNSSHVKISYAV